MTIETGRIYECVSCGNRTSEPYAHMAAEHRDVPYMGINFMERFKLIRGKLHDPSGPRSKPIQGDNPLPFPES